MSIDAATRAALLAGKDILARDHGDEPNCVGFGIGVRQRAGTFTDEPVVVAMVVKKRRPGYVARSKMLPATVRVDGRDYGVDVVETGRINTGRVLDRKPMKTIPGRSITNRMRPARQGCSVGNYNELASGTFGCLVTDTTDGSLCILSNNHVLARVNQATPGEVIVQPGGADATPVPGNEIATLKRFVPYVKGRTTPNDVDVAIAEVSGPTLVDDAVANGLMAPPGPDHKAVGLVFAGNATTGVNFITRIGPVLSKINAELLVAGATSDVTMFDHIEKVGRTTGYTSSKVTALNALIEVDMGDPGHPDTYWFDDVIVTSGFNWRGDSGSLVCLGGDGVTTVPAEEPPFCDILASLGAYYDLPLTGDEGVADDVRDDFLYLTGAGRLLVQLFYVNAQVIIDRVQGKTGSATEQSYAAQFYQKYRDFIDDVATNPDTTATVTADNLNDVGFIIYGLEKTLLSLDESRAADDLYNNVLAPTEGMTRQQVIDYMNQDAVYQQVYDAVSGVPTLDTDAWTGNG